MAAASCCRFTIAGFLARFPDLARRGTGGPDGTGRDARSAKPGVPPARSRRRGRPCASPGSPRTCGRFARVRRDARAGDGGATLNAQPVADRFNFKTADALRRKAGELGVALPFDDDVRVLLDATTVGGAEGAESNRGASDGGLRRHAGRRPVRPHGAPLPAVRRRRCRPDLVRSDERRGRGTGEPAAAVHHAGHAAGVPPASSTSQSRPRATGSVPRTNRIWCSS